jgi:hypothetical protein
VLGQAQRYGSSVTQAREPLLALKDTKRIRCASIPDHHDIRHLPKWVRSPKQIKQVEKPEEAIHLSGEAPPEPRNNRGW